MAIKRKYLGELLIDMGMVNKQQLDECLKEQRISGDRLGKIMKAKGFVTEQQLMEIMEYQLGIPFINLDTVSLSPKLADYIPVSLARKHKMVPVKAENKKLYMAMDDALDFIALEDARVVSGLEVLPMIAPENAIETAINKLYGNEYAETAIKDFAEENDSESGNGADAPTTNISNAPIVRLVNSILEQAVKLKASDIHVEPTETNVRVRMRIDGQLIAALTIPKKAQSAVLTRLKIIGSMDIAEKRLPQDGRYKLIVSGNEIDVRMSSLPTVHGEKIVMRLLDKHNFLISKEKLGFSKENIKKFNALLNNPHGIILITGPTGSGKSTTLYAMLGELNKNTENIITVEDPVEYTMGGINQVQVNSKAGLTFSTGLRSILRQDPDIIMVGEIRDQETVDIAIRAAITGHLVLSTIHTNDAPGTLSRLIDMGIPSYMLAASLVGILSQRLVKKICPFCKEIYKPTKFELSAAGLPASYNKEIYIGKGCSNCNDSGYKGRTAVHEILVIDRIIREKITNNASIDDIRDYALTKQNMTTIASECVSLMEKGFTTIQEVIKTAYSYKGDIE
ncbi:MAG: GspE/PulE family protein [Eubacteriales bacterium]|nr:GspE/PulE family protein [Eubacteriales bacterium]